MPLPSGTWKINVNGTESNLKITAPDQQGIFQGTFADVVDIKGFWDEVSQSFTFSVTIGFENNNLSVALFKGYLFRTPPNAAPGQDVNATLTGSVQLTTGGTGSVSLPFLGSSRRNVFGWAAQITEIQ